MLLKEFLKEICQKCLLCYADLKNETKEYLFSDSRDNIQKASKNTVISYLDEKKIKKIFRVLNLM